MNASSEVNELAKALSAAQGELRPAIKDSTNPHFKSAYADLASVWEACRESLSKHGLSVAQGCRAEGKAVTVETMLLHSSGQWISDSLTLEAMNAGPQSVGSAITYGRRYGLAAMVGIAPDDDDGEAAQGREVKPISDAQLSTLRDMLNALGKTEEAFCKFLQCATLEELPESRYQTALAALKAAKAKGN